MASCLVSVLVSLVSPIVVPTRPHERNTYHLTQGNEKIYYPIIPKELENLLMAFIMLEDLHFIVRIAAWLYVNNSKNNTIQAIFDFQNMCLIFQAGIWIYNSSSF